MFEQHPLNDGCGAHQKVRPVEHRFEERGRGADSASVANRRRGVTDPRIVGFVDVVNSRESDRRSGADHVLAERIRVARNGHVDRAASAARR